MEANKLDREDVRDRLILSVINYDSNRDNIEDFPYMKRGDFAILMQLLAGEQNQEGQYTAYLTVTKDMQEKWSIPERELFEMARDNSRRLFPPKILDLMEFAEACPDAIRPDGTAAPKGFVLTNEKYFNGAATLFYEPHVLDDISERMGGKDVMVFPAGANEIYCLPADSPESLEACREIFETFVKEMDRSGYLSRDVLRFVASEGSLRTISGNEVDLTLQPVNASEEIRKNAGGR